MSVQIYIDSGNLLEIEEAAKTGLINGVTTNPSLVAKEGISFEELLKKITNILKKQRIQGFTVSAEVTAKDAKNMVKQGIKLSLIDPHIIIKIPLCVEGLIAVQKLATKNIRTNVTLCFSANQALLAAKAGAYIISPFEGRLDDVGEDGTHLVEEIRDIYDNYGYDTQILAASIRSPKQVKDAALIGADIVTIPFGVFQKMFHDPLTDAGLLGFEKDWDSYEKELKKARSEKTKQKVSTRRKK